MTFFPLKLSYSSISQILATSISFRLIFTQHQTISSSLQIKKA